MEAARPWRKQRRGDGGGDSAVAAVAAVAAWQQGGGGGQRGSSGGRQRVGSATLADICQHCRDATTCTCGGYETLAATAMTGAQTINNQLKAATVMAMETATMKQLR
jgi:hypothetical protein